MQNTTNTNPDKNNMATSDSGSLSEPGNDLMLLERVFLRLGSAESDQQLEQCVGKFLPPVLLKLASPHEQVRTKVMELLVHINKRVRCRSTVQLPVDALLSMYQDEKATSFVINFTIIYLTMGFPRLPAERQLDLIPRLLTSIAARPQSHQDDILLMVMPVLGDLGNKAPTLNLKERPQQAKVLLRLALDLLLLPYGALPGNKEAGSEFPVPPGLSMVAYKRLTDKYVLDASQLEKTKQSIVKFLNSDALEDSDTLLPLIVAAADSRFSVANIASVGLGRIVSCVEWSSGRVCLPLYTLFLGGGGSAPRASACTRIRLKLLHYLNRATGAAILYPHCIQVIFASLFAQNTNPRLKTLALIFTMNVIQSGDASQLKQISPVLLGGLLKLTKMEDEWTHHAQAYTCIGRLVAKVPSAMNKKFETLEELFNKMPSSAPDLRLALREALLAMAGSFIIRQPATAAAKPDVMECEEAAGSSKASTSQSTETAMEVDKEPRPGVDSTNETLIVALLEKHMDSEDAMVRFVAGRYASVLFPRDSPLSKFLLLLASGDTKDEVKMEALKSLYGVTRPSEIEDVVQNVTPTGPEQKSIKNDEKEEEAPPELGVPPFPTMVEHVWANIARRKESSNTKHRFVTGNHVLPFAPSTYYEIMRYLRMCLNRSAGIKDGSPHPSESSPVLASYLRNLLESQNESLQHYLNMVKLLLTACPDIVPFTCLLEIVGCVPEKMSQNFTDQLSFFRTHFISSTREDIRDTAATLFGIVRAHSADKSGLEVDLQELLTRARSERNLEAQCGLLAAHCSLLERSITLWKTGAFLTLGEKDFKVQEWKPFIDGVTFLAECLTSNQNLLVSYACSNMALLGKCYALPLIDRTEKDISIVLNNISTTKEVDIKAEQSKEGTIITKLGVVNKLFTILKSAKFTSKIKEKATTALGLICLGEHFPYSKDIVKGFLEMAKETKDFEIHLQIGESLVYCVDGVNSTHNRDLWSQPVPDEDIAFRENKALTDNDQLLDWLLTELLEFVNVPHPNSRQACCIWLLALLKNCSKRNPIKCRLSAIQDAFMEFLSENNEVVQDVASKGLGLVYACCGEEERRSLVERLLEQLTGGRRSVAQVTQDTPLFEEGQLGKTPTGGNLSTYKELCSFASDLNQPDLIYKFMHLANHNAIWNSKKGAAFGFQSIIQQAGAQLSEHLPKIVPRLYRYRFDPTPKIQNSMSSIWHALVPETNKTVEKYHSEILNDLVGNLTANQWRVRMSCCLALSDLLRVSRSMSQFQSHLAEIWSQLFRVMDDVHEGTRTAAGNTTAVLSKLCIRATDTDQGKSGKEIMAVILPVILNNGITNTVAEVRQISLQTVSKLVGSAGPSLTPFLPQLIPGLLQAAGELESSRLSYLSAALGGQHHTQEAVDTLRAHAAKAHYTTDTVTKCVQYVDVACVEVMLPALLELLKGPALGSKVAVAHTLGLLAHQLGKGLQGLAGRVLSALLTALLDRNSTVRKHCADTIGTFVGCAKDSSIDKLMVKLCTWYKERDDEAVRSAIALTFQAISNRHSELLKDRSSIVMPTLFFAMHAEKTMETTATVELYEEVWSDISPSKEQGIRSHLEPICSCLKEAISSPSWSGKAQGARGLATVGREAAGALESGLARSLLLPLLEALRGRSWPGKEALLLAITTLCRCAGNVEEDELRTEVVDSVMRECGKKEPMYRRHCLVALGDILQQLKMDRFQRVYEILKDTLDKDVSSIGKDSDDDEFSNEESLKKKEHLILLKEVSYQTLGKAWPDNKETQEKYQQMFASHCAECIASNTRSVQVSILIALGLYAEKLLLLQDCPTDSQDLAFIVAHVVQLLDYSFSIPKHTRLRKEALNLLNIIGKKIKESGNTGTLEELKKLYTKYESDLVSDSAPEVRSRLVQTKVLFQP